MTFTTSTSRFCQCKSTLYSLFVHLSARPALLHSQWREEFFSSYHYLYGSFYTFCIFQCIKTAKVFTVQMAWRASWVASTLVWFDLLPRVITKVIKPIIAFLIHVQLLNVTSTLNWWPPSPCLPAGPLSGKNVHVSQVNNSPRVWIQY